jgi:DNA-binding NarL/FixJ family response regulator
MSEPIRILVVDDAASVRRSLRLRLALETDMVVIGEAGDAERAGRLAESLRPDVVLMDVVLSQSEDGIAISQALREQLPDIVTVLMSQRDDRSTRTRAARAGAAAFVGKHEPIDTLLAAIRAAVRR